MVSKVVYTLVEIRRWVVKGEEVMAMSMRVAYYRESMKSISDLRRRIARLFMLDMEAESLSGHGGIMSVGSRSLAPRGSIRPMVVDRFCCIVLAVICGTGGADSGVGVLLESAPRDFGRRIVDARLILFWLGKFAPPSRGAVCGVMGVTGVGGALPLMRASYGFFAGVMAILARDNFMEIERSRLCVAGFLMMGDAALLVEFS